MQKEPDFPVVSDITGFLPLPCFFVAPCYNLKAFIKSDDEKPGKDLTHFYGQAFHCGAGLL